MNVGARKTVLVCAALLAAATDARADDAQPLDRSVYIGIFGSATLTLGDWDLHEVADAGVAPGLLSPGLGLRVGGNTRWVGFDLNVGGLFLGGDDADDTALTYFADVYFNLLRGRWVPFVSVHGGAYQNLTDNFGADSDWRAGAGVGVRGLLTDWLVFRGDLNYVLTDGSTGGLRLASNLELLVGVEFVLWPRAEAPDDDWDKDGVKNPDDRCPRVPGNVSAQGCPDRDGDGIVDDQDACPDEPGPAEHKGCPDRDKDGIIDRNDKCPDEPGPVEHQGCPDRDKDGIIDRDDKCPDEPGPIEHKGCPDRDKDGIIDRDDKCPDEPGVPEMMGCPREKPLVLRGVNFDYNRATLLPGSSKVLDEVGQILKDHPTMRIRVNGHTDSHGTDEDNDKLSLARVKTVREYLHNTHAIALDRMEVKGWGERKPIASNDSDEGRAQNRRIDFELISK